MKSTFRLAFLAIATALASCGDSNTTTSTSTTDSNVDTRPVMAPAPSTDSGVNTGAATGATTATGNSMTDQDFVTRASSMNVAEISAHKSAATHAMSADVKMHAKHMLADHQKMGDEMKALASKKNMTISNDPPADKKQMIDDMNANKKGKDWDMAYLNAQVNDHQEAISLFESASSSVKDPDLKAMIDKTLPTLRSHLQMVQDAQSKMK